MLSILLSMLITKQKTWEGIKNIEPNRTTQLNIEGISYSDKKLLKTLIISLQM